MEKKEKPKRERTFYPTVKLLTSKILIGFAAHIGEGKHTAVTVFIERKVNEMSEREKQFYLDKYNSLTDDQKKNPKT